jgi:hypothetical protein
MPGQVAEPEFMLNDTLSQTKITFKILDMMYLFFSANPTEVQSVAQSPKGHEQGVVIGKFQLYQEAPIA